MLVGQALLDDAGEADMHRRDVGGAEAVPAPQRQHGVDAGGDPGRGGMGFHQHIHQMEAGAEAVLDDGGIQPSA